MERFVRPSELWLKARIEDCALVIPSATASAAASATAATSTSIASAHAAVVLVVSGTVSYSR